MKKKLKGFLPYLAVIFIVIIFISIYFIFFYKSTSLKRITKILDTKYDSIECIGSNCNLIKAVNDKKISLLNSKGKKIITYTSNDDNKNLYGGTDNYFITVKKVDDNTVTYILNDIEGKIIYKTNNKLEEINENYILENIKDNEYNVIKKNGKKIYSNIEKIDFYNNKEYISLKINNEYSIFNKRFEKILSNYSVDKEIKDEEDNTIYLIVKNEKTSKYSYFNIKSNKIIGEEFDKYKESENKDELIITKKQTNKNVKYLLTKKGKQIKLNDNKEQIDLVNEIKSNLKDKYYLYTSSVIDDDQKYVFVDNLKNNSFGIYELKTKKYSEIYKYSKTKNIYSNVTKLDSKKGLYYQVNCSSKKCDTPVTVVYDLTGNKVILKLESNEKLPEKYIQYNNGYKVIKYSKSSNSDYKNKYVLYDKNNKELLSSDNEIVIIDSEVILGENESTTSLVFYFAKEKKKLNDNNGEIITINNNKYYKYSSDKNIIRKFLSQPKVLNRLAANRNKKMQEYFTRKAKENLANNKIIQEYKSCINLRDEDIKKIFNERVEELGFSENSKPRCEIDDNPSMFFGVYDHGMNKVLLYRDSLKRDGVNFKEETINTIFHELTHAKQHALVREYFNLTDGITFNHEKIEDLKNLSQDDQIKLLAMLLAQCQYDYTFTNGCDSTKTVQLCDYENLNDEVEAFAYGKEAQRLLGQN